MKHRATRKQSPTLEVSIPSAVDEPLPESKTTKAKRRTNKSVSWTMWLGGFAVLIGLALVLRQTNAQEAVTSSRQEHAQEAVVQVQDAVVASLKEKAPSQRLRTPLYGNLTSALYRFEASKLGAEYLAAIAKFDEYIGQAVDPVGARFAAARTAAPGPRKYHKECFLPPQEAELLKLERSKKQHSPKGKPRIDFLREEQELFYGTSDLPNTTMITEDKRWAWRAAASYSAQYAGKQTAFRNGVQDVLNIPGQDGFFGGLVSGTFWYPPNAIREWHTNYWDMSVDERTGEPHMPWRMYYVRQKAATPDGALDTSRNLQEEPLLFRDKSAMHLVEGPGVQPERLQELGAYRLNNEQDEELNVWRIPDQNGYVSLFRLQHEKPYRWHCIVSDDSVHRYSMGISLDDKGVEAMLRYAGVEL